jgi:hypothetical protein
MEDAARRLAGEMPAGRESGSADDGRIERAQSVVGDIAVRLRRLGLRLSHEDFVALVLDLARERLADAAAEDAADDNLRRRGG